MSLLFNTSVEIIGGLALFLFAMNLLAKSLQDAVGGRIEYFLRKLTDKPHKGLVVGALVTFLTQSSSITVLTLIGLVNVGVLNLERGIGILLGAEIGTTITAQLVTVKVGALFFPLLILGMVLSASKKKNFSTIGKLIFSFGMLFLGIHLMKEGALPLKNSPEASELFAQMGVSPLLGIIVGALFTTITSSSSATTSLVVALGASSVITLPAGIALILGANIGTTALELISVYGLTITAKRIAAAQAVINILGVVVMFPFIGIYAMFIESTSTSLPHQIANSHTIFNVSSSLIFLMMTGLIVRIVKKMVPGKVIKIKRGTRYLDNNILRIPSLAVAQAGKEIKRMGKTTIEMFADISKLLKGGSDDLFEVIYKKEEHINSLEIEIGSYIQKISKRELSGDLSAEITKYVHGISDIERAGDHLYKAAARLEILHKNKILKKSDTNKLIKFLDSSAEVYQLALESFVKNDLKKSLKVTLEIKKLKTKKLRLENNFNNLSKTNQTIIIKIIHHIERAAHHGENLAQIVSSEV